MGARSQLEMNCDGTAPDASVNECKEAFFENGMASVLLLSSRTAIPETVTRLK